MVVPIDLGFEELVGGSIVGDFLKGEQGDQAFLKDLEAAFDFAFGLSIRSDAVMDAQGGESALELGVGVQAVGGSAVTEEREAIGIETGGQTKLFQQGATQGLQVVSLGTKVPPRILREWSSRVRMRVG